MGSTFQTSPASKISVRQPAPFAALRSDPSGPVPEMISSAPNASAKAASSGSPVSARTLGKFVRRTAAVCRSIPQSQPRTTCSKKAAAVREVSDPSADPGNERFRSRRSGMYRLCRSNPARFTTGTSTSVPRRNLNGSSMTIRRMVPVPLISSPWTAAVTITVGPSSGPRRTTIGISTRPPV